MRKTTRILVYLAVGFGFVLAWLPAGRSLLFGSDPTDIDMNDSLQTEDIITDDAWRTPIPDLGYREREGRALFRHYCALCHGQSGEGDGFNAYNLDPKPRDLSDHEFQTAQTDEDLAEVIGGGGGDAGLSNAMPPWGKVLGERKIGYVIAYLRTLADSLPETD